MIAWMYKEMGLILLFRTLILFCKIDKKIYENIKFLKFYATTKVVNVTNGTVFLIYYSDKSFGQNGEIKEKKWLYCVVNLPLVTYVFTKLNLVRPNWPKTEFGLFHSWPLWKSELLLLLGQQELTKKKEEIKVS